MDKNYIYLKTAFCCMACDEHIAQEEISAITEFATRSDVFGDLDVQGILKDFVAAINLEGVLFLSNFLNEITDASLSSSEELKLAEIAIKTIESDNHIEYSEIAFFKRIRERLNITDEVFMKEFPDKEDYILPDIQATDDELGSFSFWLNELNLNLS